MQLLNTSKPGASHTRVMYGATESSYMNSLQDHRQFSQRYYEYLDEFRPPNGPIFLKICGESACMGIANDYISVLAKKFGAAVVSLEHRYYGKSSPFNSLTTENLKFLSSKQALFDLAAFRQFYQDSLNLKLNRSKVENPWFVFGTSYSGALSAWFRLKFPHLTCGSLASSGVVLAVYNFTEFDQQIGESAGSECKAVLQEVNELVEKRLASDGRALKKLFNASELKIDGDFMYFLADAAAIAFQYGNPDKVCSPMIEAKKAEKDLVISNNEGELYAMSVRSPHFKWIQDFSSLDKVFTVTAGNNGYLYVTVPARALVLALDVHSGTVLWQTTIGPLSSTDCAPVVDISGWLSIGSLDGFIYLISPSGDLKKFPKATAMDMVVQVSPTLDCSGYAVYITQTEMEGKISRTIGEYTYVSALKPRNVAFTLLVPVTGVVYWSETYPGPFSSLLSKSDLRHFILDESILLAFVTASNAGNPLICHSTRQKFASSCSLASPKRVSIYTGNEKAILLFLLLETAILVMLAVLVRYCCIFWTKRKLQGQSLGKFLEKRRSLHLQKKAFDRTITKLQQKAGEEAVGNEELEQLGDLVREREGIQRKLSTTYSLGRDRGGPSRSKSLLPLYDGKTTRSLSFQSAKKGGSVTIFHTLSNTSSEDSSSEESEMRRRKGKAKVASDVSDDGYEGGSSGSRGFVGPLQVDRVLSETRGMKISDDGDSREGVQSGGGSIRRRTLSSTI